jgi:hypothetical protein
MTLRELYNKFTGGVVAAWNGFTGFVGRHKYAIAVGFLGLIAGAAFAAALVFFFPATIGTIIGLTAALPFVGAPVAAFLSSIGLIGAAAVIGAATTAVSWAAGAVGYGVVQTLRFIGNVFVGAYKGAKAEAFGAAPEQATQDDVADGVEAVNEHTDTKIAETGVAIAEARVAQHADAQAIARKVDHLEASIQQMIQRQLLAQTAETKRLVDAGVVDLGRHIDVAALAKPAEDVKRKKHTAPSSSSSSSDSDVSDDERNEKTPFQRNRASVIDFKRSSKEKPSESKKSNSTEDLLDFNAPSTPPVPTRNPAAFFTARNTTASSSSATPALDPAQDGLSFN